MTIRPDAIFFDWDGTLVDTLPAIRAAHDHVRILMGLPPYTEEEFVEAMKNSSRELFPRLYGTRGQEAIDAFYAFVIAHGHKYLNPLPGSLHMLKGLSAMGIPMALVSNKRADILAQEVAHTGVGNLFFAVVGAGMAARDKPSPDPILLAMEKSQHKLDPARIWFVGDHEPDMLAARDAGCVPVLMLHGIARPELIHKYRPAYVFENCHDLLSSLN